MTPITIRGVEVFVWRVPTDPPVETSFGIMRDRPAVLVRLTDVDGVEGWGEVWCNFPTVGAEHRARLVASDLAKMVRSQPWPDPTACWRHLTDRLAVMMIQTGEPGPYHQAIAGVEQALWDVAARREGVPLWRLLGGSEARDVPVYASGINPTDPEALASTKRDEGFRAFKLKVGFGIDRDVANLRAMRDALGPDAALMADANQGWTLPEALQAVERLADFGLLWLEEPLRADASLADWQALAGRSPITLAAGENLVGLDRFEQHIDAGVFGVIQPDIGKWGGIGGGLAVGRAAMARGQRLCPHWLGGGIGLLASLHLKTALGGAGYVEVDANPNPLRSELAMPGIEVRDGAMRLSDRPGLGAVPDLDRMERWRVAV